MYEYQEADTISETAFRRYTDACHKYYLQNSVFSTLIFLIFISLEFLNVAIYTILLLIFIFVSLLSNERVQLNILTNSMNRIQSTTYLCFLFQLLYFSLNIFDYFMILVPYWQYLTSSIFIMPSLNYWLSFQVVLLQMVFTFSFEAVFRYPTALTYESKFSWGMGYNSGMVYWARVKDQNVKF